jgi:hypothetical protein
MIPVNEDHPSQDREYSSALSTIGRALDGLPVKAFEITYNAPNYFVRIEVWRNEGNAKNAFRRTLDNVQSMFTSANPQNSSTSIFEVFYTPKQIEKLDQVSQAKPSKRAAYRRSLSRALGRIGAYVELKGGNLVQISSKGGSFIVQYATAPDTCITEELHTASWYDFLRAALSSGARAGRVDGREWALDFKSKHGLGTAERKWRAPAKNSAKG